MNSLPIHSNLSFESFDSVSQRPPSIISFATDTSTDTVHDQGIGTLSGRILYAFGEVTLRGIENLTIRRRLGKVISAYPHQDDIAMRDIETIYDHTLELSRYTIVFNVDRVGSQVRWITQIWSLSCTNPTARIAGAAYPDFDSSD